MIQSARRKSVIDEDDCWPSNDLHMRNPNSVDTNKHGPTLEGIEAFSVLGAHIKRPASKPLKNSGVATTTKSNEPNANGCDPQLLVKKEPCTDDGLERLTSAVAIKCEPPSPKRSLFDAKNTKVLVDGIRVATPKAKKRKLTESDGEKLKSQKQKLPLVKGEAENGSIRVTEEKAMLKVKLEPTADNRFEWWRDEKKVGEIPSTWKWSALHHNGVVFPPEYQPHGVKMLYNGNPVDLPPELEEVASFFAKHLEGQHYEKPRFRQNFFKDFLRILSAHKAIKKVIKKFELCDFRPILEHLKEQAAIRKARSKEEKDAEKAAKELVKQKHGVAYVDGHKEPLGNYMIEPPSLFLGRGDHPHTGRIKKRVMPEDVTLNLSEDAPVPECPIPGHRWGNIIHNHEVAWIATWTENVLGSNKYVMFGAASSIRGSSDRNKFEVARNLKYHIESIREAYKRELTSSVALERQRATALWVIDHLALRVGNEKKEDEADTVGCCSLRVEHIRLIPPSNLEFDFLGKDSMPYHKVVQVPEVIYANFKMFIGQKDGSSNIFDLLNTSILNKHLNSQMPGLTAKVFRTYNASITLQEQLGYVVKCEKKEVESDGDKKTDVELRLFYNRANRQVAILCNHQRTVSKNHDQQMQNIERQIGELDRQREELGKHMKLLKRGVVVKEEVGVVISDEMVDKKKLSLPSDPVKVKKKMDALQLRIRKLEVNKIDKGEGSVVQNSTSKINYMDPRITVAWCKKSGLDIKKIFSKSLIEKFQWAIAEVEMNPDFVW